MRFISKSAKFMLQVRPEIIEAYATGTKRVIQEAIVCDFQVVGLSQDELEFAKATFDFDGGFQNLDEVTMTDPVYRLSTFDTDEAAINRGWTEAEKAHVEAMLTDHSERFTDIIRVPVKQLPPPWPRYDEFRSGPAPLVRKLIDEGYDLAEVYAYEQSSQNRQPVLDAIEAAMAENVVEEVVG